MQRRILSHTATLLIGIVIGTTVVPGLCQQVGQKIFVGQREFEGFTTEKKLATLNQKLDYLIQAGLPVGLYVDKNGVVQSSLERSGPYSGSSGTVRIGK